MATHSYRRTASGTTIIHGYTHTFTVSAFSVPAGERIVRYRVCKVITVSNMDLRPISGQSSAPVWDTYTTNTALIGWNGGESKVKVHNGNDSNKSFNVYIDFETEDIPKHSITCKTSGSGTLKSNLSTAYEGQTVTLTPKASTGYQFSKYTSSPSVNISNNKLSMPTSDVTITAKFTNQRYNIATISEDSNKGAASGGGLYAFESTINIKATPKPGYKFVSWTAPRGTIVNPNAEETQYIISATRDTTVTAHFERSQSVVGYYNGEAFEDCVAAVYDGESFVDCDVHVYDGSAWVQCSKA